MQLVTVHTSLINKLFNDFFSPCLKVNTSICEVFTIKFVISLISFMLPFLVEISFNPIGVYA